MVSLKRTHTHWQKETGIDLCRASKTRCVATNFQVLYLRNRADRTPKTHDMIYYVVVRGVLFAHLACVDVDVVVTARLASGNANATHEHDTHTHRHSRFAGELRSSTGVSYRACVLWRMEGDDFCCVVSLSLSCSHHTQLNVFVCEMLHQCLNRTLHVYYLWYQNMMKILIFCLFFDHYWFYFVKTNIIRSTFAIFSTFSLDPHII